MPPFAPHKNNRKASTRPTVDVPERVLRGVYEQTFTKCCWATANEVYKTLKETDFNESKAIDKLNEDRSRQNKPPTPNVADEILGAFGSEPEPEDDAEEKLGNNTAEDHYHSVPRAAPTSKRASPISDPRADNQKAKRPRRNVPQKPILDNSRAMPIVINDEEDETSGDNQQTPPPPYEYEFTTNRAGLYPQAHPNFLDFISDPIEGDPMDIDSPLDLQRPALFTVNSSPAKMYPAPSNTRPSPRAQSSIRNYMLPALPQHRAGDPSQDGFRMQEGKRAMWRGRDRHPTPGPRESFAREHETVESDSEEESGLLKDNHSTRNPPKIVRREIFSDDNDAAAMYSSPLPHKKTGQGSSDVEILPTRSSPPSLNQQQVKGRQASPEILDEEEATSEVISMKTKLSHIPSSPPSMSPFKGKGKKSTIEVPINEKKASKSNTRVPPSVEEIPSSQPSPPPISRHATPELEPVNGGKEREVEEVLELGIQEVREARPRRAVKPSMRSRQASEMREAQMVESSPPTPMPMSRKKKVNGKRPSPNDEDEDKGEESYVEGTSPPPAKKSKSKPKAAAKARGGSVAKKEKEKSVVNGKKTMKDWVTVEQSEDGVEGKVDEGEKEGEKQEVVVTPVVVRRERKQREIRKSRGMGISE